MKKKEKKEKERAKGTLIIAPNKFMDAEKTNSFTEERQSIENKCVGVFSVSVNSLHQPDNLLQVNTLSEAHVTSLCELITNNPLSNTGHVISAIHTDKTTPPITKDNINSFFHEVIGGRHRTAARQKLFKASRGTNALYGTSEVKVYANLSSAEARVLASEHNNDNQSHHRNTPMIERLTLYRLEYFEQFRGEALHKWKDYVGRHHMGIIISPDPKKKKSKAINDALGKHDWKFQLALLPADEWESLENICQLFRLGKLKGQKGAPQADKDISMTKFISTQGLKPGQRHVLFSQVATGTIDLKEMADKASNMKTLKRCRDAYCSALGVADWEEATTKYPFHTSDHHLEPFLKCFSSRVAKSLTPETMIQLAETAKNYGRDRPEVIDMGERQFSEVGSWSYSFYIGTGDATVRREGAGSGNFTLAIFDTPTHWTVDHISQAIRQFETTTTSRHLCIALLGVTKSTAASAFGQVGITNNIEHVWINTGTVSATSPIINYIFLGLRGTHNTPPLDPLFVPALLEREKYHVIGADEPLNDGQLPLEVFEQLISKYTMPSECVYIGCCGSGTGVIASISLGRECMAIDEDNNQIIGAKQRINAHIEDIRAKITKDGTWIPTSGYLLPRPYHTIIHPSVLRFIIKSEEEEETPKTDKDNADMLLALDNDNNGGEIRPPEVRQEEQEQPREE
eukprot:TRINITY_DN2883_c0_g1_i1.p1 TRINITY_DN2883_c0_g1~~TRINITY_DN2883_c0_g1_i1.p1  ORF type:complete len:685 (+),score=79.24 TRINITY_DN2883_c0_g1_i1:243-2297(+)